MGENMRKEKLITISSGRDEGKKFKIREMGAVKTEKWATRALMLLASSNIDLGVDKEKLKGVEGWNNIAQAGLNKLAEIDFNKIEPLLEDLLNCCYFITGNVETQLTSENADTIIEDITTLFKLRQEAFSIHFGFFTQESLAK